MQTVTKYRQEKLLLGTGSIQILLHFSIDFKISKLPYFVNGVRNIFLVHMKCFPRPTLLSKLEYTMISFEQNHKLLEYLWKVSIADPV